MASYDSYIEGAQEIARSVLRAGKEKGDEIWRLITDKHNKAFLIGLSSVAWFLLVVMRWRLVSVISKLLLYSILSLFVWSLLAEAGFISWKPPSFEEIMISESTAISIFMKIKGLLEKFYLAAQGKDLQLFITTIIPLFLLPFISHYFSFTTLLYIAFLSWHVVQRDNIQET